MTTHIQGFIFVHGINQSQDDLKQMQGWVEWALKKNGLIDRFVHDGVTHVWCAQWRSLGDFMQDLLDLGTHKVRRDLAVADIQQMIKNAWATLQEAAKKIPDAKCSLLVVPHSMGQPLTIASLHGLQEDGKFPVPTSVLSIGGPLGNNDPVVQKYMMSALDGEPWVKMVSPSKPEAIHEWIDVWNPLDPVCHAPILGSSAYPGSQHLMFKVPGQPPIVFPGVNAIAKYHSAYFQHPEIYQVAEDMLDRLTTV